MNLADLIAAMATVVLLCCSMATRPTHGTCPPTYDLRTGIRPSGYYECWPHPVGDPEWDGTWQRPERSRQSGAVVGSRLYCTGGMRPIVVNERTVGCQR